MTTQDKPTRVYNNGNELADLLTNYKGSSQFSLVTVTVPRQNKKSRGVITDKGTLFSDLFKGLVYKTAKRHATIGVSYQNAVNGRLKKEDQPDAGEFQAEGLPFGEWREGSKVVIDYNGVPYIRVTYLNANKGESVYHYADGEQISGNDLEILKADFLPEVKTDTRQGTDNPVKVNSIKAENIMGLSIDGEFWTHRLAIR